MAQPLSLLLDLLSHNTASENDKKIGLERALEHTCNPNISENFLRELVDPVIDFYRESNYKHLAFLLLRKLIVHPNTPSLSRTKIVNVLLEILNYHQYEQYRVDQLYVVSYYAISLLSEFATSMVVSKARIPEIAVALLSQLSDAHNCEHAASRLVLLTQKPDLLSSVTLNEMAHLLITHLSKENLDVELRNHALNVLGSIAHNSATDTLTLDAMLTPLICRRNDDDINSKIRAVGYLAGNAKASTETITVLASYLFSLEHSMVRKDIIDDAFLGLALNRLTPVEFLPALSTALEALLIERARRFKAIDGLSIIASRHGWPAENLLRQLSQLISTGENHVEQCALAAALAAVVFQRANTQFFQQFLILAPRDNEAIMIMLFFIRSLLKLEQKNLLASVSARATMNKSTAAQTSAFFDLLPLLHFRCMEGQNTETLLARCESPEEVRLQFFTDPLARDQRVAFMLSLLSLGETDHALFALRDGPVDIINAYLGATTEDWVSAIFLYQCQQYQALHSREQPSTARLKFH